VGRQSDCEIGVCAVRGTCCRQKIPTLHTAASLRISHADTITSLAPNHDNYNNTYPYSIIPHVCVKLTLMVKSIMLSLYSQKINVKDRRIRTFLPAKYF
jgi:hypothetical protein